MSPARVEITPGRLALCGCWLATAALWNPWTGDWLLGSAWIESVSTRVALLAVGVAFLAWAILTPLLPVSRVVTAIHTTLFTTFLFMPLALEGLLRVAIERDLLGCRELRLYADPLSDDDYWKLKELWDPRPMSHNLDPLLGWSTQSSEKDPLGILRADGYEPRTTDVILCYGDSFMAGVTDHPHKIPDVIENRLPRWNAYNFAGGGYGLGQIYLRFRETHGQFEDPIVVVGIMVFDLDRTILSVRDRPKPRFLMRDGALVLEGPPLPADARTWHAENPPTLRSFLFARCVQSLRTAAVGGFMSEVRYRAEEKRVVNRALLEQLVAEARSRELRLLFVTFPTRQMGPAGWRIPFMEEVFEDLEVPWVDGRAALDEAARQEGVQPREYFDGRGFHPGVRGNEILGEAIAARVEELWE